jgi:hypothetical protein
MPAQTSPDDDDDAHRQFVIPHPHVVPPVITPYPWHGMTWKPGNHPPRVSPLQPGAAPRVDDPARADPSQEPYRRVLPLPRRVTHV